MDAQTSQMKRDLKTFNKIADSIIDEFLETAEIAAVYYGFSDIGRKSLKHHLLMRLLEVRTHTINQSKKE